mmetsp:Transcript_3633/g.7911  ORF Transcript_3633/g.7911 Transcript_3633/m.7911 type:complete len:408 (+) Transcript_3633:81-1304(+)
MTEPLTQVELLASALAAKKETTLTCSHSATTSTGGPTIGTVTDASTTDKTRFADSSGGPSAMKLNVAYEALEQVRKANIDIEFSSIAVEDRHRQCIPCLRESVLQNVSGKGTAIPKRGLRKRLPRNRAAPCLTCGTPVCPRHRCQNFRKEQVAICGECSKFLSYEFLVDCTDYPEDDRRSLMNQMLDVYDRSILILRYSSQYIGDVAEALQQNSKKNTKVGVGSSATGLISGVTGFVAACTIFTPLGPPLLIASVLFGSGATAASSASGAVNYHCQANKMANTIFVLHGMVRSITRLAPTALDELENDRASSVLAKAGGGTGKSATNWSRAASNAIKPLTAGALSAAAVVMEAREMKSTIQHLRAGSPCERASELKLIEKEIELLPDTTIIAEGSKKYFLIGMDTIH